MKTQRPDSIYKLFILLGLLLVFGFLRGNATQLLAAETSQTGSVTFSVNRLGDLGDRNLGDGICDISVNVGDQCTLRAAIEEINALGDQLGIHRIEFDFSGTGPFVIMPNSPLPWITTQLVIDGTSQDGTSCPTETEAANLMIVLDGTNAGETDAHGLYFRPGSDASLVEGLVVGNFEDDGVRFSSDDNIILCSHIGIDARGVSPMPNTIGVTAAGENNSVGSALVTRYRNVISKNESKNVQILGNNNRVQNNYIGTTASGFGGLVGSPSTIGNGIYIAGDNNEVGDGTEEGRNVIGGNKSDGIRINGGDSNLVLKNYIGVAQDGVTPARNGGRGVEIIADSHFNTIGSSTAPNVIAYNNVSGVRTKTNLGDTPTQNSIRGNSIFRNEDLGIDADPVGLTEQGVPLLEPALGGANLFVAIDAATNTKYDVEIYRNDECDPSGYGEGQQYLLSIELKTNSSGTAKQSIPLPVEVKPGDYITALADDGTTSEFSRCLLIPLPPTPTFTPTWTPTPTNTPTWTSTWTPTPIFTSTPTPTLVTVTPTVISTETPIATPTLMPTVTAITTMTPSATVDPEVTATATPTIPTGEPTAIPTGEPTAIPTGEPTGMPTDEPTGMPTEAPTDVSPEGPTATSTPTATLAPGEEVPTSTPTPTATVGGEGQGSGQEVEVEAEVYLPVINN